MKSKKRHHSSEEESEESEESAQSDSSSDSESDDSSHRHKKKRKHAASSESESDSQHRRSKKRKHKKKKKKHNKKKRRADSFLDSESEGVASSISEGEISPKKKHKKHKHKHSKRARSSSESEVEIVEERRLHSVVKERRASSGDRSHPHSFYQKEYHREPNDTYEREREVQRFYRGSSKERRQYQERYNNQYDREQRDRFQYQQNKHTDQKEFKDEVVAPDNYYRRPNYEQKRNKYEEHRSTHEEYHRRPREEHPREYPKLESRVGYTKHTEYEDRPPRRHDFEPNREYKERRAFPPEGERYRAREFPERRERYRDDAPAQDRGRDFRRDRPVRPEKPSSSYNETESRREDRDRNRRPEVKEDKYRDDRRERHDKSPDRRNDRSPERRNDRSPERRNDREKERDRPPVKPDLKPREKKSRFDNEDGKEYSWGKTEVKKESTDPDDKEKPNFGLSGKLTADQNTVNGVVIKYTEPDDAKQPKRRWRFYPFKGDKALPILYIHRQSSFLIGRDKKVVDIALDHPSISKQHAALQYRATPFTRHDGSTGRRVRPYVIDLESANGTFVNNKKIEARRYIELLERDVVKFGFSQREYVLLHENSKDEALDDDHDPPPVTTTDKIKQEKRIKQEVAEDG